MRCTSESLLRSPRAAVAAPCSRPDVPRGPLLRATCYNTCSRSCRQPPHRQACVPLDPVLDLLLHGAPPLVPSPSPSASMTHPAQRSAGDGSPHRALPLRSSRPCVVAVSSRGPRTPLRRFSPAIAPTADAPSTLLPCVAPQPPLLSAQPAFRRSSPVSATTTSSPLTGAPSATKAHHERVLLICADMPAA
ncbi:uncharacterized protein [Miscanthus floridulus]|uniref:uncharacterized protein n=1 Tax=Miscanthus floridulus TaxID=154761 RepID=UPI00345B4BCF